jgi:hypothetical protein
MDGLFIMETGKRVFPPPMQRYIQLTSWLAWMQCGNPTLSIDPDQCMGSDSGSQTSSYETDPQTATTSWEIHGSTPPLIKKNRAWIHALPLQFSEILKLIKQ